MKLHTSMVGVLAALVVLSGVFGLSTPTPAQAASNGANITQLKEALELLRGNMLRLKEEHGSSTRKMEERMMRGASSTKPFGEDKMRHSSSTRATSTKAIDRTCMQEAVNTREEAIMDAFESFASSTLSAMEKRQAAFASVWADSSVNNPSKYNGIWVTWKKDTESARKQLNTKRVAAWKTFHTTATQTCKATLPKAESGNQEMGATAI